MGAEVLWLVDHYTGWFPQELWTPDFSWLARRGGSQDAYFDWQVMAGYHAARLPGRRLGVGVTEPLRRHPVTLAQALWGIETICKHSVARRCRGHPWTTVESKG